MCLLYGPVETVKDKVSPLLESTKQNPYETWENWICGCQAEPKNVKKQNLLYKYIIQNKLCHIKCKVPRICIELLKQVIDAVWCNSTYFNKRFFWSVVLMASYYPVPYVSQNNGTSLKTTRSCMSSPDKGTRAPASKNQRTINTPSGRRQFSYKKGEWSPFVIQSEQPGSLGWPLIIHPFLYNIPVVV